LRVAAIVYRLKDAGELAVVHRVADNSRESHRFSEIYMKLLAQTKQRFFRDHRLVGEEGAAPRELRFCDEVIREELVEERGVFREARDVGQHDLPTTPRG
jgi:hypothetical protein